MITKLLAFPIYPLGKRPWPGPPDCWRVRVEYGPAVGLDKDFPTPEEADWWFSLIRETQPSARELIELDFGYW